MDDYKTTVELISDYRNGTRHFISWDFNDGDSVAGMDLSDAVFEDCFIGIDFRSCKLVNSKFINCNLKTADFSRADLTNALIKNCSVESVIFKDAKTDNLQFEENYCYGAVVNQSDFAEYFDDADEN